MVARRNGERPLALATLALASHTLCAIGPVVTCSPLPRLREYVLQPSICRAAGG